MKFANYHLLTTHLELYSQYTQLHRLMYRALWRGRGLAFATTVVLSEVLIVTPALTTFFYILAAILVPYLLSEHLLQAAFFFRRRLESECD